MIDAYLRDRQTNHGPFLDELASVDGSINPQWARLASSLEKMGEEKLQSYSDEVSKLLRENGVTYNVYGDPTGMNRPWRLDPVPFIFSQENWVTIEKGLKQRAHLLNIILRDIYGERKLIREGLLPFEMIYNHKGFLRQVDKIRLPGEHQLIQYSADLTRGPDGQLWVLHDRTDAPSGAGYTLENRSTMTRVFPDLIRENKVRKVSVYYQKLKETISNIASQDTENLRIVMLSPGEGNETFFEHAYMASFMGFTLAVGEDLAFKNGYVWLKTIRGLEKVDVIIRRVDDIFCDPLEFKSDSHLGVVGLMEAIRQKKVMVINPLGSRILENPGLMAFLPNICQQVLGEDLILPSVATWWCGHENAKEYVLDNMENLVVKQIYRSVANKSVVGSGLGSDRLGELKDKINQRPELFVGQELVEFSTTPALVNGHLSARNATFRSYVVADAENGDYFVMPGGLTRSSPEQGTFIVSNQSGGISKDTWVLGKAEDAPVKVEYTSMAVKKAENILPSRTGEHLFWQGRYLERCSYTARVLRMACRKYNEAEGTSDPTLDTLLKGLVELTATDLPEMTKKGKIKKPEKELLSLAVDGSRMGTLSYSLSSFLFNSYAVRDRLSLDTWRILDTISDERDQMKSHAKSLRHLHHHLDNMIIKLMAFNGLNIDNMTREPSWHLLNIGRFIESSIGLCVLLKSLLVKKADSDEFKNLLEYVLIANESLITYRYRYRSTLELESVLNLLLVEEDNPRSLIYQVQKVDYHISHLPAQEHGPVYDLIRKKLLQTMTEIRLCDLDKLIITNAKTQKHTGLEDFLTGIIAKLQETSDLILKRYFSHTESVFSFVKSDSIPEI